MSAAPLLMEFLAGLGLFLYGLRQLTHGIQAFASRELRMALSRSTRRPLSAVAIGTVTTALLHSSSTVSLLTMAFASAGVIPLFNAVGIILGANLGTTLTGWTVTLVGFKLDLARAALPMLGFGALSLVLLPQDQERWRALGSCLLGFGLFLLGLDHMKTAMGSLPAQLDPAWLAGLSAPVYLLLGVTMTVLIQSSTAMMMIALSALSAGFIQLPDAAALVIGADIGTTSTTALGAMKAPRIAKQLACAHVLFNLAVDSVAFLLLLPMLPVLLGWLRQDDPLLGLVTFYSLFNFLGILAFLPFLRRYSTWLDGFFPEKNPLDSMLDNTPPTVPAAAISACEKAVYRLLVLVFSLNLRNLKLSMPVLHPRAEWQPFLDAVFPPELSFEQRYERTMTFEGRIRRYVMHIPLRHVPPPDIDKLECLIACSRDAVYSAKGLRDVRELLARFRHHEQEALQQLVEHYHVAQSRFYIHALELLTTTQTRAYALEVVGELQRSNEMTHQHQHDAILATGYTKSISSADISELLNVNREIWHANIALLRALQAWFSA